MYYSIKTFIHCSNKSLLSNSRLFQEKQLMKSLTGILQIARVSVKIAIIIEAEKSEIVTFL